MCARFEPARLSKLHRLGRAWFASRALISSARILPADSYRPNPGGVAHQPRHDRVPNWDSRLQLAFQAELLRAKSSFQYPYGGLCRTVRLRVVWYRPFGRSLLNSIHFERLQGLKYELRNRWLVVGAHDNARMA